jgi:hypothetical protein
VVLHLAAGKSATAIHGATAIPLVEEAGALANTYTNSCESTAVPAPEQ